MIEWKYDFTFKEKQLTAIKSIDLCLRTFPKLLLLLAPKVTSSLYPECIANLKLPVDTFYRESHSGVNIANRNITTGLYGLRNALMLVIFVHFKGFNISQKSKSSPLSYFEQKTSLNLVPNWYPIIFTCPVLSDSCSYISNIDIFIH
jgi:hypothetical protein